MTTIRFRPDLRARDEDALLAELTSVVLASLPRKDQRAKGVEYVEGLLRAEGRKSMRNIAAHIGGLATEQSVHHFISGSTWGWEPVRDALNRFMLASAPPSAWVLRHIVIPKTGNHSVGVSKRFVPELGQTLNGQHAVGVWAVSEAATCPVDWRLHLSPAWLEDRTRRSRAAIPHDVRPESLTSCMVNAFLDMSRRWDVPTLPVVFDAGGANHVTMLRQVRGKGRPVLARIDRTCPLIVVDPALPAHSAEPMPAHKIILSATRWRRLVEPGFPGGGEFVAGARVRLAAREGTGYGQCGGLMLVGTGQRHQPWPNQLWLTDMVDTPYAVFPRVGRLLARVDHDLEAISAPVGLRDYVGRSFDGWHRHATLASVAHAVRALGGTTRAGHGTPDGQALVAS